MRRKNAGKMLVFHICKWCLIYNGPAKRINMFALGLWPCLTFFGMKITYILKSSGWGLEKREFAMETKFFIAIGVFSVQLLACQVSMLCAANWPR